MESEVKQRNQRNRRRERAQRMQAQRESKSRDGDSAEDESPAREKPQRPSRRRKSKEPPFEEDIIDGFSILAFRTYEELENAMKHSGKTNNLKAMVAEEKPKLDTGQRNNNHIAPIPSQGIVLLNHDAGTSDDSGRASERLNGPGVPRDRDSSHDRLSDASSHCSSGKGYICDSEGEDDKGSDAGSDLFTATRKHELPGNPPPINNGTGSPGGGSGSTSPVPSSPPPIPPPPRLPTPIHSPTPPLATQLTAVSNGPLPQRVGPSSISMPVSPPMPAPVSAPPPPVLPLPMQPQTSTPIPPPVSQQQPLVHSRTNSPAVAPSVPSAPNSYPPLPLAAYPNPHPHSHPHSAPHPHPHSHPHPPHHVHSHPHPAYPPLYAPYSTTLQHSPYLPQPAASPLASPRNDPITRTVRSPCQLIAKQPQLSGGSATIPRDPTPATAASAPIATTTTAPTVTTATAIVATTTTTSHRDIVTTPMVGRSHSPRGHSPNRERDSYSSNVSSLSRSSITPVSAAALSSSVIASNSSPFSSAPAVPSVVSSSLTFTKTQVWGSSAGAQLSPAASIPRPTPPPVPLPAAHPIHPSSHSFPPPMFAPPMPPPTATASPLSLPAAANPNPFSAESLFQSNQADLLRRELDSRFLASQDRTLNVGPPPYLRTEMHHHQHQHTHVHQHTTSMLPPAPSLPPGPSIFPPPIFKEIPKLGGVDSPFYRQNLGLTSYPGFSPGLLHPSLGGSTPFAPPNHLPTFTPKQMGDPSKPKPVKTGRWNAMHVRIAWEIYHHQQKQQAEAKAGAGKAELLRPPNHLFPGGLAPPPRPHELPSFATSLSAHRGPPFEAPHPSSYLNPPAPHLGSGVSPFGRYPAAFSGPNSAFPGLGASVFPPPRDIPPLGAMGAVHDPWSRLQRTAGGFPPSAANPWSLKPEPSALERRAELEERERERERERDRERCRREREREEQRERERREREREEKQRKLEAAERERERREKERREIERRELERERLLHQQRVVDSTNKVISRDRSPLRNGTTPDGEAVRVKEEPRSGKEDDVVLLGRPTAAAPADARYHPHHYLSRHPHGIPPPTLLDRSRAVPPGLGGPPLPPHFPAGPGATWPASDPFRDSAYRYDPMHLRFNPLMAAAAFRAEEEEQRAKLFQTFPPPTGPHLRAKAPSPSGPLQNNHHLHHRAGPGPGTHKLTCPTPPSARPLDASHVVDLHKKEESSQSR